MSHRLALSARLALFYVAIFSAIGVHLPFWPLWLKDKGLDPTQIGYLLAATFLSKIVFNPIVGHVVDRRGDRRRPLMALAGAALLMFLLFLVADGFWQLLAVTAVSAAAFASMMPVGENLTLLTARAHGLDYGRIRLWGSLAFIAASMLGGMVVARMPDSVVLWMVVLGLAATLFSTLPLPDATTPPSGPRKGGAGWFYRHPLFLLFLGATALGQTSHMIYYGFATIHWQAAGLSGGVIGALWAEGVVAEIVLFAFGARILAVLGPAKLLVLAGLGGIVRWTVLAATTDLVVLATANWLHAFTFGAMHLGSMHFIVRAAPHALSARAQTIYSSVTMGLAPGLAMLLAGRFYEALGGWAFLIAAALSAAAAGLALALVRHWDGDVLAPRGAG